MKYTARVARVVDRIGEIESRMEESALKLKKNCECKATTASEKVLQKRKQANNTKS